jgi:uncharacterized protein YndB with AHSA1/START domain
MTDQKLLGSLREEGGKGVVRVEDVYATDIQDLWGAITDPARLARWVVEVEGDLRVGGDFTASFTSGWEGPGSVEICEKPTRLLVRTWQPGGDATAIEATLSSEGPGTRLVIEERGLSLEEYAGHGAGWQAHIEDLRAHLEGREAGDWAARWRVLSPAYDQLAARAVG